MATRRRRAKPAHRLEPPPRPPRSRTRFGLVALLAVVTVAVASGLLAAAVRPPWELRYTGPARAVPTVTAVSTWEPSRFPSAIPGDVPGSGRINGEPSILTEPFFWLTVAGAALLLVAGVLLLRWWRGRIPVGAAVDTLDADLAPEPQLPVLQRGAEEASRRLLGEQNSTDAIITAWLALEEAASSSGITRAPSQTPTEFTADVLTGTGVDREPVETLLALYLRARFSASGARPEDLAMARRCVHDLAEAWRTYRLESVSQS